MSVQRGVPIELDRERRLRYTLGAMRDIEERLGVDIMAGDPINFAQLEDVVWLVWLGLYHAGETMDEADLPWYQRILVFLGVVDQPPIKLDQVEEWIDMQNLLTVTEALDIAFGGDQIEAVEEMARKKDPTLSRTQESA